MLPILNCNWLQIMENSVDTTHTYYLHGHMSVVKNLPTLAQGGYFYRPITDYDWAVCRWGIEKTCTYGGDKPELEIRPPLIFPNILRIPEGPIEALHFDRWLAIFAETAQDLCPPAAAAHFIDRARRIAGSLALGVAAVRRDEPWTGRKA